MYLCLVESLLKTAVLAKFTPRLVLDFLSFFFEVNIMDDRCALVTKFHALRILFHCPTRGETRVITRVVITRT